jgi:hypothetical protein
MSIKEELMKTLEEIDSRLGNFGMGTEAKAMLLVARANVLIALQKYEVGGILD